MSQTVIELIKEHEFKTVLDFGAGICQDSIVAVREGLEATAADIPGKTFDFGKWRIKKYNNSHHKLQIPYPNQLIVPKALIVTSYGKYFF